MNARRPSCVIFDLDGTLLDTEDLYTRSAALVCARYEAEYTLELKRRVMGGDTKSGARLVVESLRLPITPEQYVIERERELHVLLPSATPMPGAELLVAALIAQRLPLAIATSGHRAITGQKLARQPFLSALKHIVCGDDARLLHPKPAPDIYLLAARELGIEPGACIVIEDSALGVRAGIAAGMQTIALVDPRWGFAHDQFAGAERIISSLEELSLDLLGLA